MPGKVEAMLLHLLCVSHTAPTAMERSLAARDGFAFSLLWSTGLRGINAREACCSDFWLPATAAQPCQPALPYITPVFMLSPGTVVELVPQRLKTSISANALGVQLAVQECQLMCPVRWLSLHIQCSNAAGSPISNLLVRPLNRQGSAFLEKHLENASLLCRLIALLKQLQMYAGESLHSFRRGVAQQLKASGSQESEILQQLLIQTPAVLNKCYLSSGRYYSGVKRVRGSDCPRPDPEDM